MKLDRQAYEEALAEERLALGLIGSGPDVALAAGGRIVTFNPSLHPRDPNGKFAKVLGDLIDSSTKSREVHLPGGTKITKGRHEDYVKVREPSGHTVEHYAKAEPGDHIAEQERQNIADSIIGRDTPKRREPNHKGLTPVKGPDSKAPSHGIGKGDTIELTKSSIGGVGTKGDRYKVSKVDGDMISARKGSTTYTFHKDELKKVGAAPKRIGPERPRQGMPSDPRANKDDLGRILRERDTSEPGATPSGGGDGARVEFEKGGKRVGGNVNKEEGDIVHVSTDEGDVIKLPRDRVLPPSTKALHPPDTQLVTHVDSKSEGAAQGKPNPIKGPGTNPAKDTPEQAASRAKLRQELQGKNVEQLERMANPGRGVSYGTSTYANNMVRFEIHRELETKRGQENKKQSADMKADQGHTPMDRIAYERALAMERAERGVDLSLVSEAKRSIAGYEASKKSKPSSSGAPNQEFEGKHPRGFGGQFITAGSSNAPQPVTNGIKRKLGGELTKSSIEQFQRKHGLEVDGIIGHQTATAILGKQGAKNVAVGALTKHDKRQLFTVFHAQGR